MNRKIEILKEKILMWIAWHLPHGVIKWAFVRLSTNACDEKYPTQVVPDLTCLDALQRWEKGDKYR